MKYSYLYVLCPAVLMACTGKHSTQLDIVPFPAQVEVTGGQYTLSSAEGDLSSTITFASLPAGDSLPAEGYRLEISKQGISIQAGDEAGRFYAMQTIRQLYFAAGSKSQSTVQLPCLRITDYPMYAWRGLMLDVARHFRSVEHLKKQIDLLAYYKMNKLHLHLTDDQGWRVEIKKYPELTAKGEYYTQAQLRELVRYATERHVEIIPEVDMPGHMSAAIAVMPELSSAHGTGWGTTFSYPLCPCKESTYTFVQNVLDEVSDIFPSPFLHIGVDEVDKTTWNASPECKALMRELGYEKADQLQGYFVERVYRYLAAKGKQVIAWDEVLENKEAHPEITVMCWRDWVGNVPERALADGHHIILSPTSPMYFSQRDSTLYPVYNVYRKLLSLPADKQSLVRGAQACVWSEVVTNDTIAFRTVYPKLLALSEALWTPADRKDWRSFVCRMDKQRLYLDEQRIPHTGTSYALIPEMTVDFERQAIVLRLESELAQSNIYYTVNDSVPTPDSFAYNPKTGIRVTDSARVCAAVFANGAIQRPFLRRAMDWHTAIGKPVSYTHPWHVAYPAAGQKTLTDGLRGGERYTDGFWQGFSTDLEVVIDLSQPKTVTQVETMFMQQIGPGVYLPEYIDVSLSSDGQTYTPALRLTHQIATTDRRPVRHTFKGTMPPVQTRYVKLFAKNARGFIFTDEVIIR